MSKPKTLRIFPNPFHALDHDGHPNAVMPKEPEGHVGNPIDNREFIGAQMRHEFIDPVLPDGDARQRRQRTRFVFSDDAVTVPHTAYYRFALVRREVIAADEETAKAIGMAFVEPGPALEAERAAAIGFRARMAHEDHDEDAPEELSSFAFGPMPQAIAARKAAAGDAEKQARADATAAEALAKQVAKAASDKAAADARAAASNPQPKATE